MAPRRSSSALCALLVTATLTLAACHDKTGDVIGGPGGAGTTGGTSGNGGGATGGTSGSGNTFPDADLGFHPPDAGPPDDGSSGGDATDNCGQLMAVIRDFNDTHP